MEGGGAVSEGCLCVCGSERTFPEQRFSLFPSTVQTGALSLLLRFISQIQASASRRVNVDVDLCKSSHVGYVSIAADVNMSG